MPKSLSGDLRERVIEAVQAGASRREAAERFEISASAAVKWLQRGPPRDVARRCRAARLAVGAIMACVGERYRSKTDTTERM
jgi:transposase